MRSSVCQDLIGCFGGAIAGLTETGTGSRAIVHYRHKPRLGAFGETALNASSVSVRKHGKNQYDGGRQAQDLRWQRAFADSF
jgi:hypothetical protein